MLIISYDILERCRTRSVVGMLISCEWPLAKALPSSNNAKFPVLHGWFFQTSSHQCCSRSSRRNNRDHLRHCEEYMRITENMKSWRHNIITVETGITRNYNAMYIIAYRSSKQEAHQMVRRQSVAPLKFDPKPSEATFLAVFRTSINAIGSS